VIVHWPEELVVQPLGEAPEVGLQAPATETPFTAAPEESTTVTVIDPVQVVLPLVVPVASELRWSRPMLVSLKLTDGFDPPLAAAATLYVPWLAFAVNVEEVATPLAFVVATHWYVCGLVVQLPPAANVALAPLAGAPKVTETPDFALP
jgi:hypothetical protein